MNGCGCGAVAQKAVKCTYFEEWVSNDTCGCPTTGYSTGDTVEFCIDGQILIAQSLVDDNTDHPIAGSTGMSPTWTVFTLESLIAASGGGGLTVAQVNALITAAILAANHADLNGNTVETFSVADAVALTDATSLQQVQALLAGIGIGHADANGNAANLFSVADAIALTEATSLGQVNALIAAAIAGGGGPFALLAGDAAQLFNVANAVALTEAVNLGQVTALLAAAGHADTNGNALNLFSVADAVALTEATSLQQVNALIAAAIAGGGGPFALLAGDAAQLFNVADAVALTEATSLQQVQAMLAAAGHADTNGNIANLFSVANAVAGTDAVNLSQTNALIAAAIALANHADLNGDDTQIFEVADHAGNPFEAVNFQMLQNEMALANHAQLNGDPSENFEVAAAIALDQAVNLQQLNDSIGIPDWVVGNAHHLVMGSDGNAYRLPQGGDPTIDPVGAPLFAWRTLDNTSTRNDIQWVYPLVAAPYAQYTGPGAGPITWVAYARSLAGVVSMQGFVRRLNTGTTDDLVFTLPVGYRPEVIIDVPVVVELDGRTIMRVYPSGAVHIRADFGWHGGDPLTFVAMDITFQASN